MDLKDKHTKALAIKFESLWPMNDGRSSAKPVHLATYVVNEIYADLLIAGVEGALEYKRPVTRLADIAVHVDVRFNQIHTLLIRRGEWDAEIRGVDGDWLMVEGADGHRAHCATWQGCIRHYFSQRAT